MNKEGINWLIKHLYGLITDHLSYREQNNRDYLLNIAA